MLYHLFPRKLSSENIHDGQLIDSLLVLESLGNKTQKVKVQKFLNKIQINNARIIDGPHFASNGILYEVSKILQPPSNTIKTLMFNSDYSIFLLAIKRANLDDVVSELKGATIFVSHVTEFTSEKLNILKF